MLNRCLNTESSLEIGTLSTWRHCETSRGRSFVVRSSEDTHPALNTGQEMNYNYHQYRAAQAGNQQHAPHHHSMETSPAVYTSARYYRYFQAVYTSGSYSYCVGYLRHFVGFVLSLGDRRAVILAHFKFRPTPPAWSLLRAQV